MILLNEKTGSSLKSTFKLHTQKKKQSKHTQKTPDGHLVLHVKVPASEGATTTGASSPSSAGDAEEAWQWYILNDFLVEPTIVEDALGFLPAWKEPCVLLYRDRNSAAEACAHWARLLEAATAAGAPASRIAPAVFESPSLSAAAPGPRTFTPLPAEKLPVRALLVFTCAGLLDWVWGGVCVCI